MVKLASLQPRFGSIGYSGLLSQGKRLLDMVAERLRLSNNGGVRLESDLPSGFLFQFAAHSKRPDLARQAAHNK